MVKENKARKHARALQSQSSELTIYTDLTPTCYFVKVIASPIDQVDRVVEGALAKDGFLRSEFVVQKSTDATFPVLSEFSQRADSVRKPK